MIIIIITIINHVVGRLDLDLFLFFKEKRI